MINKFKSYDIWRVERYKPETVLNLLSSIDIFDVEVDGFTTIFKSSIKNRKFIKKTIKTAIKTTNSGILVVFNKVFLSFSLIFSVLISLVLYFFLNTLIIDIRIEGDYPLIENDILLSLENEGLSKFKSFPSSEKLLEIENNVYEAYYSKIEFLEIRREGVIINIKYTKRRTSDQLPIPSKCIYATKDGIIKKVVVKKGQVEVETNQYVKKGELLINDTIIDNYNHEIYVGCEGKIYAFTWYLYTLEEEINNFTGKDEAFIEMLNKIRGEVGKNINNDDEYIEKENILQFDIIASKIILKVHYTLVEDITR